MKGQDVVKGSRFTLINKKPKEVWSILTEAGHLQKWPCEKAAVDLKPGGKFEFSGISTVAGGSQKLTDVRAPERLTFEWPMFGAKTAVTWRLESQLDMTRLVVDHEATATPEISFTNYCDPNKFFGQRRVNLDDLWREALGRLKYYADTGKTAFQAELNVEPADDVVHTMTVAVSAEKAFAALTEPAQMDQWLSQKAAVDLVPGGKFSYGWTGGGPDKVISFKPGKEISHTWNYLNEPETSVTWKVEAAGASAKVTLVHSGFFSERGYAFHDYNCGWAAYMQNLRIYLELGLGSESYEGGQS